MVIYYNLIQLRIRWEISEIKPKNHAIEWSTCKQAVERTDTEPKKIKNGNVEMVECMWKKLVPEVADARFAMQ